jgi:multidrug efflux pump subunit AcrB
MMKIVEFFIGRPKLVNLILIFILLMGSLNLITLNKKGYPSVEYGFVSISTVYPGASPEDVELKITNKIEEKLRSIDGIKELTSRSMESYSVIQIRLDDSSDADKTKADIRKAVDQVDDLPSDIKNKPLVVELNTDIIPLIEVAIAGTADYRIKRQYAKSLEDFFVESSMVGSVEKYGYLEQEVKVEVDQKKLIQNYVSLGEIMSAITAHNFRMSVGDLKSNNDEKKLLVMSEFAYPKEVGKVIVRSDFDGNRIVVSDVAKIIDDYEKAEKITRTDSFDSINLLVRKKPQADIVRASKEIQTILADFQKGLPDNVQANLIVDYSVETLNLLDLVINNAKFGFILVLLALLILLNFKVAFWTAVSIPVSILLALSFFPLFGVSINFISLTGIIIVLGMIVDDAIIVGENIYHYREKGFSPLESARKGVGEVLWPVITTIATTIVVFLPMLFMKGIMGKFMYELPIAVSLILIASLLECLFILPTHISHVKVNKNKKKKKTWFNKFEDAYENLLKILLRFKYLTVFIFFSIFIFSIFLMVMVMQFRLFPSDDGLYAFISFETVEGMSVEETAKRAKKIEDKLKPFLNKYISSYVSTIGQKIPDIADYGTNYMSGSIGNIMIYLIPMKERDLTSKQIVNLFKKEVKDIQGFSKIEVDIIEDGPPVGRPITVTLISDNDPIRNKVVANVKEFLEKQKAVFNVEDNEGKGKKRIDLTFDYILMSSLGLNAQSVANTIRAAYEGMVVTQLRWQGEDIAFRVILNESARYSLSSLKETSINSVKALNVMNNQGKLIPLGQFVKLEENNDRLMINHYEGKRAVTIFADVDDKIMTPLEANNILRNYLNDLESQYPELRIIFGGEEQDTNEAMESLYIALLLALVGIYFILVVLFNSFTQPFLVMIAIPFSLSGVIFTFFSHNLPLSFPALIGLIGLTGVVVNDSLIMITFLNQKKEENDISIESIALAAKRRLRPIVLTTTTTLAGLFPTAYGFGGDNPFIIPMILAIAWGLLFATIITLVLIPSLYVIQHNVNQRLKSVCIGCDKELIE